MLVSVFPGAERGGGLDEGFEHDEPALSRVIVELNDGDTPVSVGASEPFVERVELEPERVVDGTVGGAEQVGHELAGHAHSARFQGAPGGTGPSPSSLANPPHHRTPCGASVTGSGWLGSKQINLTDERNPRWRP